MRKTFLLVAILCSCIFYAQQEENAIEVESYQEFEKVLTYGAKAGINLASVKGDYVDLDYISDLEGFVGFHAGGWINYAFHPKMAIQGELLGSLQGGDIQFEDIVNPFSGETVSPKGEIRLPYIAMPVMFQYKPIPKWYLEAGPQMNILLKVNFKALVNGQELSEEDSQLIDNRLNDSRTLDLGLNIGTGYEFIDKFTVYTRYSHGLITVDARENNQRDLKNRVLQFGLAYTF